MDKPFLNDTAKVINIAEPSKITDKQAKIEVNDVLVIDGVEYPINDDRIQNIEVRKESINKDGYVKINYIFKNTGKESTLGFAWNTKIDEKYDHAELVENQKLFSLEKDFISKDSAVNLYSNGKKAYTLTFDDVEKTFGGVNLEYDSSSRTLKAQSEEILIKTDQTIIMDPGLGTGDGDNKLTKNYENLTWSLFRANAARNGFYNGTINITGLKLIWSFTVDHNVTASPAVLNDTVFFGSDSGRFYALNATTGLHIWNRTTNGSIRSSPVMSNGVVYFFSRDNRTYALNASTGTLIWSRNIVINNSNPSYGTMFSSSPLINNGLLYIGSVDGYFRALNVSNGTTIWEFIDSNTADAIVSAPALSGDYLYFGKNNGNMYALNASTGSWIWTFNISNFTNANNTLTLYYGSPTVLDGIVYIGIDDDDGRAGGSGENNTLALNATTGNLIWNFSAPEGFSSMSPAVANGVVYTLSEQTAGAIYALNSSNGNLIWNRTGIISQSSPVVTNNIVLLGGGSGGTEGFIALNITNGAVVWNGSDHVPFQIFRSSAAIEDGIIYVGTSSGNFYAFGLNNPPAITVNEPSLGNVSDGSFNLSWIASDADGDSLSLGCWADIDMSGFDRVLECFSQRTNINRTCDTHNWPAGQTFYVWCEANDTMDTSRDYSSGNLTIQHNNSWPMFRGDIGHTGFHNGSFNITNFNLLWNFSADTFLLGSPIVANDRVYVTANTNNKTYAINASTGNHIWNFTGIGSTDASPAYSADTVYIGYLNGWFFALNASTGTQRWNISVPTDISSSATVSVDRVYFTDSDRLFSVNISNGVQLGNVTIGNSVSSSPAVMNDLIYIANNTGTVLALNRSGLGIVWRYNTGGTVGISSVAVHKNVLYAVSQKPILYALNASNGNHIWNFTGLLGIESTSPAIFDAGSVVRVFIASNTTNNGTLYAINATNGAQLWNFSVSAKIVNAPSVSSPGIVFFNSNNNRTYAINASTGDHIWNYTTTSEPESSPAIANNRLFVAGGQLYAFSSNSSPTITVQLPDSANISDSSFTINWTASDLDSSPLNISCYGDTNYAGTDKILTCFENTNNDGTQSCDTSNWPAGQVFTIWCSATDSQNIAIDYASGNLSIEHYNSWPMFHADSAHTGYTSGNRSMTNFGILWNFNVPTFSLVNPTVFDNVVYFSSTQNRTVYALNSSNGNHVWNFTTGDTVRVAPAVYNGRVYFGSVDDFFYALNASTGAMVWNFSTGGDIGSSAVIANNIVYFGSDSNRLYALNATNGRQIWNASLASIVGGSSPAVFNQFVFLGDNSGTFYAFNSSSGVQIWNFTAGGFIVSSPSATSQRVVFGSADNRVYALNMTGAMVWNFTTGDDVRGSSPAIVNNTVYIGSLDNRLYALNLSNGTQRWNFSTNDNIETSPAVINDVVFFTSDDNLTYAVNASTGVHIWNYTTGSGATTASSPAIAEGKIFIGATNGQMYAFTNVTDTRAPNISVQAPPNNSYFSVQRVDFNYTVGDNVAISTCLIRNSTGNTILTSATCVNASFNFSEGRHSANVSVNDTSGNQNSSLVNFTIDLTLPLAFNLTFRETGVAGGSDLNVTPTANAQLNVTVIDTNVGDVNLSNGSVVNMNNLGSIYNTTGNANQLGCPANGLCTIRVLAYDLAGNLNNSLFVTIRVDNSTPNVTLNTPLTGQNFSGNINIQGNWTDGANGSGVTSVNLVLANNTGAGFTIVAATVSQNNFNYTLNITGLSDGTFNLTVNASDAVGFVNDTVRSNNFRIDTTPPQAVNSSLREDGVAGASDFNVTPTTNIRLNITVVDSGTNIADVNVSNGTVLRMTASPSAGIYNLTTTPNALGCNANALCEVTFRAYDILGNVNSSVTLTFRVDNNSPQVSNLTLDETAAGSSDLNMTPAASIMLNVSIIDSGSGIADVNVSNGSVLRMTASPSSSIYNLTTTPNALGCNANALCEITVRAFDAAGNSNTTVILTFRVDNTSANVSVNSISSDQNFSGSFNVAGNLTDGGSGTNNTNMRLLVVNNSGAGLQEFLATVTSGTWNYTILTSAFGDGTYNLTANGSDIAGNINDTTTIRNIRIDTTRPTVFNFTLDESAAGASDYNVTPSANVFLNVTVLDSVNVFQVNVSNGSEISMALSPSASIYNLTTTASDLGCANNAACMLTIKAYDEAGNLNNSVTLTFRVDNIAPNVSINVPVTGGNVTSNHVFQGNVSDSGTTIDSVTIVIRNNSGAGIQTYTPTFVQGSWNLTWLTSSFADGTYNVTVNASDTVGNRNDTVSATNFRLDIAAPQVVNLSMDETAAGASDFNVTLTNNILFNVTVIDSVNVAYVNISNGTEIAMRISPTASIYNLTTTPSALGCANNAICTAIVKAYDSTGNLNNTVSLTFRVDSAGPNITINNPVTNDNESSNPRIQGNWTDATAIDAITVVIVNNSGAGVQTYAATVTTNNWNLTWLTTGFSDGFYNVTINATDVVGNRNDTVTSSNVTLNTRGPQVFNITFRESALTTASDFNVTPSATVLINVTAIDVEGILAVNISNGSELVMTLSPTTNIYNITTTASDLGCANDALCKLTIKAYDNLGNLNSTESITIRVDNTRPSLTINNPSVGENFSSDIDVAGNFTDTGSDINTTSVRLLITNNSGAGRQELTATVSSSTWNFTMRTSAFNDGTYNITVNGTDNVGNRNDTTTITNFRIDTAAPQVTNFSIFETQGTANDRNVTPSTSIIFNVTVLDGSSGVFQVNVSNGTVLSLTSSPSTGIYNLTTTPNALGCNANALCQVTVRAFDVADNSNTTITLTFRVDNNSPVVENLTLDEAAAGASDLNVTYTQSVSINVSVADGASGSSVFQVNASNGSILTFTASPSTGIFNTTTTPSALGCANNSLCRITVNAIDQVSNLNSSVTLTFRVDNASPNVTINSPTSGQTISGNVNMQGNVTESTGSGLNTVTLSIINNSGGGVQILTPTFSDGTWNFTMRSSVFNDGTYNMTVNASDILGNANDTVSATNFRIDTGAPTLSVASPRNGTYYSSTIDVNYTAADSNRDACFVRNATGQLQVLASCANATLQLGSTNGQINITIWVNDTQGGTANETILIWSDNTNPSASDIRSNTTISTPGVGFNITMLVNVTDNLNFSYYVFSWNDTGTFVNDSIVALTGNNTSVNASKNITAAVGNMVGYRFYTYDRANNSAASSIGNFTVKQRAIPQVSLSNPLNNSFTTQNSSRIFNWTGTENYLVYQFLFNSSTPPILQNFSGNSITNFTFNVNLSDGTYYWRVRANDSGTVNDSFIFQFVVDVTAPALNVASPSSVRYYATSFDVNYTAFDTNRNACFARNATGQIQTLASCDNATLQLGSTNSQINITVWVNDSAGNTNNATIQVWSDNTNPSVTNLRDNSTDTTPVPGANISILVNASDNLNLSYYIFSWNDTGTFVNDSIVTLNGNNTVINVSKNVTSLANMMVGYRFYVYDRANNSVATSVGNFTTKQTGIPTPSLQNPANNSFTTANSSRIFNWSNTNAAFVYQLLFNSSTPPSPQIFSATGASNYTYNFNLSDATYYWQVIANDSGEINASTTFQFVVDVTSPTLNVASPSSGRYYATSFDVNYTASDANRNACFVRNATGQLQVLASCANATLQLGNTNGQLNITVWVNDSASNTNNATVQIWSDNTSPTLMNIRDNSTETTPFRGQNISMFVNVTDNLNLSYYIFSWNDSGSFLNDSIVALTGNSTVINVSKNVTASVGSMIGYRFYIYDRANNSAASSVGNFTIKTIPVARPSPSSPANNSFTTTNSSTAFSWTNNQSGVTYQLLLNSSSPPQPQIFSAAGIGNFTYNFNLSDATHYWRLIANDSGSTNFSDTFQFTIDTRNPALIIGTPTNASYSSSVNISISFTASDANRNACYYTNTTGSNVIIANCANITFRSDDGLRNITVVVNDSAGNVNSSTIFFTVDATAPAVTITSPTNASHHNSTNVSITYSISEINLDRCYYRNTTGSDIIITSCANITFNSDAGLRNITLTVNDTSGNTNSTQIFFTVDLTNPSLIVVDPVNATTYSSNNRSINYTASDANRDACYYTNTTGSNVIIANCVNITFRSDEGLRNITVRVNDSSGRTNSSTIFFTTDSAAPTLNVQSPSSGRYYATRANVNYTASDTTRDTCYVRNATNAIQILASCANASVELPNDGQVNITIYVNDSFARLTNSTIQIWADNTNPSATDVRSNSTLSSPLVGDNVTMWVNASDNLNLSYYLFSWNDTGTFVNDSPVAVTGTTNVINVSKVVNTARNTTVGYRFYIYDMANNSVASSLGNFTVNGTDVLKPNLTHPPNNSVTLQNSSTIFNWTNVQGDVYYHLFFGTANPPTAIIFTGRGASNYTYHFNLSDGSYYWFVRGNASPTTNNSDIFRFSVDTTRPRINMTIRNLGVTGFNDTNQEYTGTRNVLLNLSIPVDSNVTHCRFSNEDRVFTKYEACLSTKVWILTGLNGLKTVYLQGLDNTTGLVQEVNDTITLNTSGGNLDTTPSSTPIVSDEGNYTNDNTTLKVSWTNVTDHESDLLHIPIEFYYGIGTTNTTINVVGFTYAGTNNNYTITGLNLTEGTTYYVTIRAVNSAGLEVNGSSNGITIDVTAPAAPTVSSSHSSTTWSSNNSPYFTFNSTDTSGIASYSYGLDSSNTTSPDNIPEDGNSTTITNVGDGTLYFHVKARDNAGNWGSAQHYKIQVDSTPPTIPQMLSPVQTANTTEIKLNWTASEDISAVTQYLAEVGTTQGGNDTHVSVLGNITNLTVSGLSSGTTYYARVRAKNGAGLWSSFSDTVSSTLDTVPPAITFKRAQGTQAGNVINLAIRTSENSTCSYRQGSQSYQNFTFTGQTFHESRIITTNSSFFNYDIRCLDTIGNINETKTNFTVSPGTASSITIKNHTGAIISKPMEIFVNVSASSTGIGAIDKSRFKIEFSQKKVDDFSVFDGNGGNYTIKLFPPQTVGSYFMNITVDNAQTSATVNVVDTKLRIRYSNGTSSISHNKATYSKSESVAVGIASDGKSTNVSSSGSTLEITNSIMDGKAYVFVTKQDADIAARQRLLVQQNFEEQPKPSFGYRLQEDEYTTIIQLNYPDIAILANGTRQTGKHDIVIKNLGYNSTLNKTMIQVTAR